MKTRRRTTNKARIARGVKKFAKKRDLGVNALARECGFPKSYVSAVMTGQLMPSAERVSIFAHVLNVSIEEILFVR